MPIAPELVIRNGKRAVVPESLQDRIFTCAYQGKLVHCEISAGSMAKMQNVMHLFFGGFED